MGGTSGYMVKFMLEVDVECKNFLIQMHGFLCPRVFNIVLLLHLNEIYSYLNIDCFIGLMWR